MFNPRQTAWCASGVDSAREVQLAVLIRIGGGGLVVDVSRWKSSPHLHGRQTHSNQMGSSHPRHDCVPKDSSVVDAEMRKERPRILDRDGLTHEMDESTDTTRPHTCSECGTDRSRNAVPYLVLDRVMAVYASAARGARFESWPAGAARRADADGLGETARRTRERPWVGPTRPSTLMRRHRSHIRLRRCRRTLAGRSLA